MLRLDGTALPGQLRVNSPIFSFSSFSVFRGCLLNLRMRNAWTCARARGLAHERRIRKVWENSLRFSARGGWDEGRRERRARARERERKLGAAPPPHAGWGLLFFNGRLSSHEVDHAGQRLQRGGSCVDHTSVARVFRLLADGVQGVCTFDRVNAHQAPRVHRKTVGVCLERAR